MNTIALYGTALMCSLTYLAIIFSWYITFKYIGVDICYLLAFIQVSGTTGLYPVEMASAYFPDNRQASAFYLRH
ncbi:MAG: hypothetical protein HUJ51_04680 [Eggerthellaceae bacterium]|nr:hypothetical protein [Eggerthellaceae bacterium]